ncbi:hypothetical protein [Pontibacillus sp. HMF3514]|uniref:hypothetical protein n=1 Tax=Pontibacillus sp. HMF3514 TaxID=2692425 RepID=UPI001320248E|nr:hypothetical protein [Pontibacillus sp. HMF3514]QHE50976.1 hypothetical protein GS400_02495 [Pontibacillus sp. HMF3514]
MRKISLLFLISIIFIISGCAHNQVKPKDFEVKDKDVQVQFDGIIDGTNVRYDEEAKALWTLNSFKWKDDKLTFNADFQSETVYPTELKFIDSIVFLRLEGLYPYKPTGNEGVDSFEHKPLTNIIPMTCEEAQKGKCSFQFDLKLEKINRQTKKQYLDNLSLRIGWVQIFEDEENQIKYYQWSQADNRNIKPGVVDFKEAYEKISGEFLSYKPLKESETTNLNEFNNFNYIEWIEENIFR